MKISFSVIVCCLLIVGCIPSENKTKESQKEEHSHHQAEVSEKLTLNNGVRWKTDESTKRNVFAIRDLVILLDEKQLQTIEDYHTAADEIKAKTNILIKECKMQGADHDALHLWLHPLLDDIKALSISTEPETSKQLFESILHRLYAFDTYFE
jgi:hypothetical protein